MVLKNSSTIRNFGNFLFYYNFTGKVGNLSFLINFNEPIEFINIKFPRFIDENKTFIEIEDCEYIQNCTKNSSIKIRRSFQKYPINQPYYTELDLRDFSKNMDDKKVIINFTNLIIEPSGVFQFYSPHNKFEYSWYAVNLILGDNYLCNYKCTENIKGMLKYPLSTEQNIKLQLEEREVDSFIFGMYGVINKKKLFCKEFSFALGVSFTSSSIFYLIGFVFNYSINKRRKTPI